ncbi:serine-aspartate repeat-containing protein F-like [Lytechinus pictus]|uniref:serine-aspartate repeat-containing protein F-like n=1 Tax=Lytechinus pictus TaxID=7653 RepID=UPI0030B9D00E
MLLLLRVTEDDSDGFRKNVLTTEALKMFHSTNISDAYSDTTSEWSLEDGLQSTLYYPVNTLKEVEIEDDNADDSYQPGHNVSIEVTEDDSDGFRKNVLTTEALKMFHSTNISDAYSDTTSEWSLEDGLQSTLYYPVNTLKEVEIEDDNADDSYQPGHNVSIEVTEDDSDGFRKNVLTTEALKMFHSTNISDAYSDTTSEWSLEDGLQSTLYYPVNTLKQVEIEDDNVDDSYQPGHNVSIEGDSESFLSDSTSSLLRFMDQMDNDSLTDVSSIASDDEYDVDTFTTVSDLTDFDDELFDDDNITEDDSDGFRKNVLTTEALKMFHSTNISDAYSDTTSEWSLEDGLQSTLYYPVNTLKEVEIEDDNADDSYQPGHNVSIEVTEDDSDGFRKNVLTTEALKMFHSTNISDAYSDTTSEWSLEDGLQSTLYYPVNTLKEVEIEDDNADDSYQPGHNVSIEVTEDDSDGFRKNVLTTEALKMFHSTNISDAYSDTTSEWSLEDGLQSTLYYPVNTLKEVEIEDDNADDSYQPGHNVSIEVTEDDSDGFRKNVLTTEALKMFHSTNISDAYSDTTSEWSLEDGLQSTLYYPVNTLKQVEIEDDNVDDSYQPGHNVSIEGDSESFLSDSTSSLLRFMDQMDNDSLTDVSSIASDDEYDVDTFTTVSDLTDFDDELFDDDNITEDDSDGFRKNVLTTEALKMFHSTNISDAYSDTTSEWSLEDGLQSTLYYPVNTLKQVEIEDDNVDDSYQPGHNVSIEGDSESFLSDSTSSLLRFMDQMDNDSLTDVSSIASDDEYDVDTFTTVSDLTDFDDELFDDDNSDVVLEMSLPKVEYGLIDNALSVATTFLNEIMAEVASELNSKK